MSTLNTGCAPNLAIKMLTIAYKNIYKKARLVKKRFGSINHGIS